MAPDREHRIRERAHALWEQEGRPEGRHEDHWHQASREVGDDEGPGRRPATDGRSPSITDAPEPVGDSLEEIAKGEHQGP